MRKMDRNGLKFCGWGLVGAPQEGIIVRGDGGLDSIDVTGYSEYDYWGGDGFLGPDIAGITPVYERPDGTQFPADAVSYPYLA